MTGHSEHRWNSYRPQTIAALERSIEVRRAKYEQARDALVEAEERLEMVLDMRNTIFRRAEEIIHACCYEHDILYNTVVSKHRHKRVVECRSEICYRLMGEIGLSACEIGRMINRDHATVLYLASRWSNLNSLPPVTSSDYHGRGVERANLWHERNEKKSPLRMGERR
jgi:chromosomal replication initiation ATPase DnaA